MGQNCLRTSLDAEQNFNFKEDTKKIIKSLMLDL